MERQVTGFHQDAEGHWVAELECGTTRTSIMTRHGSAVRGDAIVEDLP